MAELNEDHFELTEYIDKCNTYELSRLYDEYKRIRKKQTIN